MPRLQMPDGALLDLPNDSTPEAQDAAARDYLSTMPKQGQAQPMDQNESVIQQAPEETWWDTAKKKALDYAETFPAMSSDKAQENRFARSAAALSIVDQYRQKGVAVSPSDVETNLDRYTGHKEVRPGVRGLGLRNGLDYDEAVNLGMGVLVATGLGTAPISTALGVAGFEALGYFKGNLLDQTRRSYLTAKDIFATGPGDDLFTNRRTFEPGTYRNLRDFLPDTASTPLKAIFDAAEFAAMGKTLHAVYGPAKIAAQHAFEVATHSVITEVRGPERVFISPEKIRDIFQTGEKIGPEEADLVSSLGLNAQQYRNAFDYGLNIEVPTAKVTRMVEKPWWSKVRELFKIDPHEAYTAQTEVMGETKGTIPVAALPEGGAAAARPPVATPAPSGGAGPSIVGEPATEAVGAAAGQAWAGFMVKDAPAESAAKAQGAVDLAGADFSKPEQVAEAARLWEQLGTDSPYFKWWFGDSKVVDAQGKPLVVYHGTNQGFESFDPKKLGLVTKSKSAKAGFFFVSDKATAQGYADLAGSKGVQDLIDLSQKLERQQKWDAANEAMRKAEELEASGKHLENGRVVETYLTLKNPVEIDAEGQRFLDFEDEIHGAIEKAKAEGADGVIIKNLDDNADWGSGRLADHYIAFDPTQIKSVFNRGTFDAGDARILMQTAPGTTTAPGLTVDAVKAELADLEAAGLLPPGINVVQSVAELPPNIRATMTPEIAAKRVLGAYDQRSRLAYIVADSLRSPADVLGTGLHEAATHGGLHAMAEEMAAKDGRMFGPSYQALQAELLSIYDSHQVEALALAQRYGIKPTGANGQFTASEKARIAEELVASHSGEPDKWTDRYIAAIQRWIREIAKALGKTWEVSEAEVRDLLRRAREASFRRAAGQGQPQGLGPSAERVTASFSAEERTPEEAAREIAATSLYPEVKPAPDSPDMAYLTMLSEASARALKASMKKMARRPVEITVDAKQTALESFQAGVLASGGLDKAYVEANYPPEIVAVLNAGNMLKKGGAHPEALAQQLGYSDESAMLNTVYGALTETLTAEQALRAQLEASGDMARHALDSDEYAAYLDEQAKILERLLGGPRTRKAPKILDPGNPTFAELQVDESAALEAALKRAERASRDAFRAGDVEGALEQKEHQKAIVARARARREMRQEISGIKRELEKAAANTKLPLEYQDRVATILDSVDIRRGAQTQKRLDSLAEFLDRQEALGEDTSYIPVELIERLQKTPLSTYTIEDLRDLRSSVARLVHLGGLKNKLIASKQARDFESTVQDLVVGIFDKANLDALELSQSKDVPLLGVEQPSLFGKLRAPADVWLAQSMGPEFIVRALDGFKHEGPVHDAIWGAQKHANDAELLRHEQHREAMDRILAPVIAEGHKFFSKKYTVPGVRGLLTMNQAVSIHLNSQRPINVDHLVRGNKLTVDEIKAVSDWLPEQYRQMAEEVWAYNESLFEDINANNIALSGERLQKTAGRYYPASMDYALTQRGNQQLAAMAAGEKLQESPYIRPGTRASFRERASGGNQPLKLDISVWVQHLMAEAVDTTRTLAARDTSRLLMDQRVRQAITLARGEDEYNALVSWVKVQRDTGRPRMDSVDKLLEGLRGNFTTAQLVLNIGNILQQPFSLLNVASEPGIGPLDMAWGIGNYVANPIAATAFATSKSVAMRNRISFETMAGDRELAAMAAKANALDAGLIAEAKRLGFYPTVLMDRIATVSAWNIGYRKGMLDFNGDEAKAIDYADSLMSRTQSSNDKLHRPELMNAQGWRRFVTMFMTWQMAYTNQFRENVGRVVDQPSAENILHFTKYVFWALLVQTAITSPLQYGRLPDKKELAKDIAIAPLRGLPLVGPLANTFGRMAIGAYAPPYSASPLERIPQGMVDLGAAMKSKTAGSGTRAWLEALELGSYATGVPVAPITKAVRTVQQKKKTGKGNVLNLAVPRQRELNK